MKTYEEIRFKGTDEEINEQWLERRKDGIGGSDAAAILGLSKYATPMTVWLEKTQRVEPDDISNKEPVYWGKILEDVVACEFARRHPDWKVRRLNAMLISKEHPHMFASVDRVVTDDRGRKGILEIKTAGEHRKQDWADGIPEYYLPQPIHYLAVTGYEFYAVAVLIGGQHYEEFIYERDQEDIDFLIEREGAFWHLVETDSMPEVTGRPADTEAILSMHSDPNDEFIDVLSADIPEIAELVTLKEEEKNLKERIGEVQNIIKSRIGDSKGIMTSTHKVTWVRSDSTRFNAKRFQEENPEMAERYTESFSRDGGLRISEVN